MNVSLQQALAGLLNICALSHAASSSPSPLLQTGLETLGLRELPGVEGSVPCPCSSGAVGCVPDAGCPPLGCSCVVRRGAGKPLQHCLSLPALGTWEEMLNRSLTFAQLLKRISFVFSYFTRTVQARFGGLNWQVKPQVGNDNKRLLKPELALSHWALTMCLKLNPCLIGLLNKTGITGTLSQHQWLGKLALLLSEQRKRL